MPHQTARPARTALRRVLLSALAGMVVLGDAGAASAQWLAVGRWGSGDRFQFVAPGTWMVLQQDDRVEISAEGDNHVTRLTIGCRAGDAAAWVELSRYLGHALPRPIDPLEPAATVEIVLDIDDHRIGLPVTYSRAHQTWRAEAALDSEALPPLTWGRALTVRAPDDSVIATYRMRGTTPARDALRRVCGL